MLTTVADFCTSSLPNSDDLFTSTPHLLPNRFFITKRFNHSLHIQKTRGINAPIATNIGSIAGESSFSYGSRAFGPLGLRLNKGNKIKLFAKFLWAYFRVFLFWYLLLK